MKHLIITVVVTIFWMTAALAQPTISQLMNLDIGDKYTMKEGGFDITSAMITEGSDQMWDFSVLPPDDKPAMGICIDPASTPFSDSSEVKNSNVAIKSYEAEDDTTHIYQFLRVSGNKCETMALGAYNRIIQQNISYTKWLDPAISLELPFSYGDSYTDKHVLWINHLPDNTIVLKDTSNTLYEAVGYGTLKTPAGTFQNALLVKETVDWVWWNNYSNTVYKTQGTDINYHWIAPGIKIPVMSVNLVDETGGIVNYISGTQFQNGGIDNPSDNGGDDDNDNGENGDDDDEPYDPADVWLNVCGSAGEYFAKSAGSLSWTMGEAVMETLEGSSHYFTQGFNQPNEVITSTEEQKKEDKILVYPNPFKTELNIRINDFTEPVSGTIYSNAGQALRNFTLNDPVSELRLNDLKPGMYFIRLMKDNSKTFIVVKQ